MSYLSAPLWFMFLALSTALQVVHALTEPQYFLQPRQLFPVWPQWRPELAIALFASTMVLLFLPKLLSIILVWCKGPKEYGGFIRVTLSLLLEVLFSVLLAAGPYAVPHRLRGQRLPRLGGGMEFAAA